MDQHPITSLAQVEHVLGKAAAETHSRHVYFANSSVWVECCGGLGTSVEVDIVGDPSDRQAEAAAWVAKHFDEVYEEASTQQQKRERATATANG